MPLDPNLFPSPACQPGPPGHGLDELEIIQLAERERAIEEHGLIDDHGTRYVLLAPRDDTRNIALNASELVGLWAVYRHGVNQGGLPQDEAERYTARATELLKIAFQLAPEVAHHEMSAALWLMGDQGVAPPPGAPAAVRVSRAPPPMLAPEFFDPFGRPLMRLQPSPDTRAVPLGAGDAVALWSIYQQRADAEAEQNNKVGWQANYFRSIEFLRVAYELDANRAYHGAECALHLMAATPDRVLH